MSYEGFEVLGAEEVHEYLVRQARSLLQPLDVEAAVREEAEIVKATSRWSPREVKLGLDTPKVEVRLSRASAMIVVLPPRHRILAVEAMREIDYILEWASGVGRYPVLVYYSRKGTMTTAAYLYLGNVMEEANIGILFVNGPPTEVADVLGVLEAKGEYTPSEEGYVSFNF